MRSSITLTNSFLAKIAQLAVEVVQTDGRHEPTFILESATQPVAIPLRFVANTPEERRKQMTKVGELVAREPIGPLQGIAHISDAWVTQNSDRQEMLVITHHDLTTHQSSLLMYKKTRDNVGNLIDIHLVDHEEGTAPTNPLLEAFIRSYQSNRVVRSRTKWL